MNPMDMQNAFREYSQWLKKQWPGIPMPGESGTVGQHTGGSGYEPGFPMY